VAIVGLLLLQFASVRRLFWDVTRDEAIACAAAVIATWAIYPLTDLYNRAALPEFFAITALQTGSCLWVFYARSPARRQRASVFAGLLVTLAAGIHPPTALFGGLTFAALWLASLVWCPERAILLRRSLAIALAAAVVLAPWLYVVERFSADLRIVRVKSPLSIYPGSIDAVATRLSALPTSGPPGAVGTPNVDTQISVPFAAAFVLLAVVALASRARARRARPDLVFAALCAAVMCALFRLSTSPSAWDLVPKAFTLIQFPCRLTAFISLAALGALAGVLAALARDDRPVASARSRFVLGAAVVLATLGVGLKLPRCLEGGSGPDSVVTDYANPPRDWYFGYDDYATPDAFAKLDGAAPREPVRLTVGAPKNGFGVVGSVHVHAGARTQISTNVQAFPWNALTIDGQPVSREALLSDGGRLAAWIGAGEHEVGYAFRPDRAWSALRVSSFGLLAFWALGGALGPILARAWARRARSSRPVPGRDAIATRLSRIL